MVDDRMDQGNNNRRDLLKKLGATAGFSIFGTGLASAEPDTLGSVQFVEVSLTHEIKDSKVIDSKENLIDISIDDSKRNLIHIAIDELPSSIVDEEAGNLYLSDFITEEEVELFESSDGVVKNYYDDSYRSLPASFDQVYKEWIVIETVPGDTNYRPVDGYLMYDRYDFPDIQINDAGGVLIPSTGVNQRSQSSTVESYQLPTETVGLLAEEEKDRMESVYDTDLDTVVDIPVIEEVELPILAIPSLTVHNHGTLDVVISSERAQFQTQNDMED